MKALGLGILKGGLIGGALGYGAYRLGLSGSAWKYLLYGVVGLVVGLIAGRPIWRNLIDKETTVWTSAPTRRIVFARPERICASAS